MWLMDERQKLTDVTIVVQRLATTLEALASQVTQLREDGQRRKEEQITLEARLDRVEHGRRLASRMPVPTWGSIPSASSLAPSWSSLSSPASSSPSSCSSRSASSASSPGDKEHP